MKASTQQLRMDPATSEEHGNRADVPNILEEDEIKDCLLYTSLQILLHNAQGPFDGLPRAAGWGYPDVYKRQARDR